MTLDRPIASSVSGLTHCLKRPIVGAFTATATKYVENDIKKLLGLDKANVYVTGFDRPNLSFSVIRTPKRMDYVVPLCASTR